MTNIQFYILLFIAIPAFIITTIFILLGLLFYYPFYELRIYNKNRGKKNEAENTES